MHKLATAVLVLAAALSAEVSPQAPVCTARFVTRLLDPISVRTAHAGDSFTAVVVSPATCQDHILVPQGSLVMGKIAKVIRVGIGVMHERSGVELHLTEWQRPGGMWKPLTARLVAVDNAREQVSGNGRITGILAAGGPPGFLLGMWQRPDDDLFFLRTALGFAGVSRFIAQRCELNPMVVAGVYVLRLTAVPSPDPEIFFPAGTDLVLSLSGTPPEDSDSIEPPPPLPSSEMLAWVSTLPTQTSRPKSDRSGDMTNLVFLGSRQQLVQAFTAAGWLEPDLLTHHSMGRMYRSMSMQSGYSTAPMSTLLLDDNPADLSFEKSLNTVARRHHIRIWQEKSYDGGQAWLGAATHDVGVHFGAHGFDHEIDPHVDDERARVIDDLTFAGCAETAEFAPRAGAMDTGRAISTDGQIAVVTLRDCEAPPAPSTKRPHDAWALWLARRMVLEARYSVLRGNIYYWGYRACRHYVLAQRDHKFLLAGR